MKMFFRRARFVLASAALTLSLGAALATAEEPADPAAAPAATESQSIKFGEEGGLTLAAPGAWKKVDPSVNIIEHEFSIAAAEGDEMPAGMTIMGAGGSVDDNVTRWLGQFKQADGSATKDKAKIEKTTIAGLEVRLVDVAGNYDDSRGPFQKGVQRENYRMLAAIVIAPKRGNYFIKFYGPAKTVAANAEAFQAMIKSLQAK